MINKLTKMFTASQEAPVKTPEPPPEPSTSEAQNETPVLQTPEEQESVQQPIAAENISLLKLCDAKLAKLSKYFTGSDESVAVAPPTEQQNDAARSASEITPAPAQETVAAENISLLQICDAKLSKLTKFFTGPEETPAVSPKALSEERTDGSNAATTTVSPTPQEPPSVPDMASLPNIQDTVSDKISEPSSHPTTDVPVDFSSETVLPDAAAITPPISAAPIQEDEASSLTQEMPVDFHMAETVKIPPGTSPDEKSPGIIFTDNADAIAELNRKLESTISEQLLNLERRLDQHIEDAIHAENERIAFREELRQQLHAAAHSYEQPLLEHKNMIETTLKSAFKKIVDRQAILENKYNQQIDMIQQVIGTNQENINETAEKLNKLSEQARLLNENIRQLTQNIEAFQAKVDIDTVNARLAALENPPKKKRKSWFKK